MLPEKQRTILTHTSSRRFEVESRFNMHSLTSNWRRNDGWPCLARIPLKIIGKRHVNHRALNNYTNIWKGLHGSGNYKLSSLAEITESFCHFLVMLVIISFTYQAAGHALLHFLLHCPRSDHMTCTRVGAHFGACMIFWDFGDSRNVFTELFTHVRIIVFTRRKNPGGENIRLSGIGRNLPALEAAFFRRQATLLQRPFAWTNFVA